MGSRSRFGDRTPNLKQMRVLTTSEAREWARLSGWTFRTPEIPPSRKSRPAKSFLLPCDSGHKSALSRLVASTFCESGGGLFWITEHGIWPSSEVPWLFDAYRQTLGEATPLTNAPAHVIGHTEQDAFMGLLALSLYFIWGSIVLQPKGHVMLYFSHDEWLDIFGEDQSDLEGLVRDLEAFGLKEIQ